jgi:hypothetical protein
VRDEKGDIKTIIESTIENATGESLSEGKRTVKTQPRKVDERKQEE